jgi:hypothetical protein
MFQESIIKCEVSVFQLTFDAFVKVVSMRKGYIKSSEYQRPKVAVFID